MVYKEDTDDWTVGFAWPCCPQSQIGVLGKRIFGSRKDGRICRGPSGLKWHALHIRYINLKLLLVINNLQQYGLSYQWHSMWLFQLFYKICFIQIFSLYRIKCTYFSKAHKLQRKHIKSWISVKDEVGTYCAQMQYKRQLIIHQANHIAYALWLAQLPSYIHRSGMYVPH